jgi:RHS repeat-associated protein
VRVADRVNSRTASINGQAGKLTHPQYSYDAHGNIAGVTSGGGGNGGQRTHSWTSFDNPLSMSVSYPALANPANALGTAPATLSAGQASMSWLYGPEHQRIRETFSKTENGQTSAKTLHILHPDNEGSLYFEREIKTAGAGAGTAQGTENRHYLSAEKGSFLVLTSNGGIQTEAQSSSGITNPTALANAEQRYWHKDHLGSIVASTNSNLTVIERMAYDPFGKRRFTNGAYDQVGTIDGQSTNRGFTGHEHLDELDFIHMNARVYDPDIGRFLSPDPTIAHPHNPQSFNRYSYAYNNPLNAVDPTGFTVEGTPEFVGPPSPGQQGGLDLGQNGTAVTGNATTAATPNTPSKTTNLGFLGRLASVFPADAPIHQMGKALAAVTAVDVGKVTGDQALTDIGMQELHTDVQANYSLLGALVGRGKAPGNKGSGLNVSPSRTTPPGDRNRQGAFREAKQDAGIPRSQHPDQQPDGRQFTSEPMTDKNGRAVLGPDGKPTMTREYTFTREDGSKVVVQDHSAGHKFGQGGKGDQGSHFNVRPAENTRTGTVPGTKGHYPW